MNRNMQENTVRKRIRALVIRDPGIRFQELKECTGINESTLRYHVKWLLRKGEISVDTGSGEKRLFPSRGMGRDNRRPGRIECRILDMVMDDPGISFKELLEMINTRKKDLNRIIERMVKDGQLVVFRDEDTRVRRYMTPEVYSELRFRDLVHDLVNGKIGEDEFIKKNNELKRRFENEG